MPGPGQREVPGSPHPPQSDIGPSNDFVPMAREEIRQSIAQAFERRAAAWPNRVALKCGQGLMTYDALNRAANRVAHAILSRRGDASEPVALCLEHGEPALIGLLGALKPRKFYVPFSP